MTKRNLDLHGNERGFHEQALDVLELIVQGHAGALHADLTTAATTSGLSAAEAVAALNVPASARHLVYVHGICKHTAGYSDPLWAALQPFETAFGAGTLGDTRLEELWSDVITPDSTPSALALAPAVSDRADERQTMAAEIRDELRMRAAQHAIVSAAP